MNYIASSLEDIAKMFEELAARAVLEREALTTKRSKRYLTGRAHAYQDAANILRLTKWEVKQ